MIRWNDGLVDAIARRRVVLLIGSGVSANSSTPDGRRPKTWGAFLNDVYKGLGKSRAHISRALKRYAYLEACDYLKGELGPEWHNTIRSEFELPAYKPAKIHEAIFNLDCRIVASLNFDRIYENYAAKTTEGTVIIKNYYDGDIRQAVSGGDRYIIKPHGSVDTVSKLIFTLEDYGKARNEYASFYDVFSSLLHTHIFLCVGCGLTDPDLQLIFEDYRYKHHEFPHYIVLPAPVTIAEKDQIKRTRGLNVLQYSPRDNHAELTRALSELALEVSARRDVIAKDRSW